MSQLPGQIYSDLKSQLPSLIDALKQGVEYGGELFHRFILFDIVKNVIEIVVLAIVSIILVKLCLKGIRQWEEIYKNNWEPLFFCFFAISGFTVVFFFIVIVCDLQIIAKDIFIPELRVLEIISNLTTTQQ